MIVKFNENEPFETAWNGETEIAKCVICGKQAASRIYYHLYDERNCVCRECESTIKGMYKDIIIADSSEKADILEKNLKRFSEEVKEQMKFLQNKYMFKYYLEVEIEDYFHDTYNIEEIQQKDICSSYDREIQFNQMKSQMYEKFGEYPYIIKFFETTHYIVEDNYDLKNGSSICGIAKIYNNGTTVIFGNDPIDLIRSRFNPYGESNSDYCKCNK